MSLRRPSASWILTAAALALAAPLAAAGEESPPSVLIVTIDTLRADRVSAYGYSRRTTPGLDELMATGVRFSRARSEVPLTGPAMTTMLTSLAPHQHGASRNGLRMREGLASLPKALARNRYRTVAVVANWTLRDRLTGMAEHFDVYQEVLTRSRWMGLFRSEARAADVTDAGLDWLREHVRPGSKAPVLLWTHYTDPHAPYRPHGEFREQLGLGPRSPLDRRDRYDTEVAYTDQQVTRLLEGLERIDAEREWLIVLAGDHGESLGEHGYWGHGRNTHEPGLHIPLAIVWPGRVVPGVQGAPIVLADVTPTVLSLLGLAESAHFSGFDWAPVLRDEAQPPEDRVTFHQAHRGAVQSHRGQDFARSQGLLEVARIDSSEKEILRVAGGGQCLRFDLAEDPQERRDLAAPEGRCSEAIRDWAKRVHDGLRVSDELPPPSLSEEDLEQLRSLGYLD